MKRGSVTLCYMAPVYVVVEQADDMDRARVVKVVVDDENTNFQSSGRTSAVDEDGENLPPDDPDIAEAQLAVDGDDEFPAWEFGW